MPAKTADQHLGQVLGGRYRVVAKVARGGMATVYEAIDERLDRPVAVKVMHTGLGDDSEFAQRFVREARAAARLSHQNVVAVYDQGDDDGRVFLVMEYAPGRTLRDLIRHEAPLDPERVLDLILPVLDALGAAHDAGLVHRDIKPENVLLTRHQQVKVADFGLARAITPTGDTSTRGLLMGTVSYLPPELVTDGRFDARSDVYSVGIVLYEMLTGRKPHTGDSPIQVAYRHVHTDVPAPSLLNPDVPPYLDALVARATARDYTLRPADAHVMARQARSVRSALADGLADDPDLTQDLILPLTGVRHHRERISNEDTDPAMPPWAEDDEPSWPPVDRAADDDPGGEQHREHTPVEPAHSLAVAAELSDLVLFSSDRDDPAPAARSYTVSEVHGHDAEAGHYDEVPDRYAADDGVDDDDGDDRYSRYDRDDHDEAYDRDDRSDDPHAAGSTQRRTLAAGPISAAPIRRRKRGLLVGVLVVLLALLAGVGAWYWTSGRFATSPALAGRTIDEAVAAAKRDNLTATVVAQAYSETVPKGGVISTEPGAGVRMLRGGEIGLTVSLGKERYVVPKLVGMTLDNARTAISAGRLNVGTTTGVYHEKAPINQVIAQSKTPGISATRSTVVNLTYSQGPRPITVPNLTNRTEKSASATLTKLGLQVSTSQAFSDTVDNGSVISQTVSTTNGAVHKGDTVALVISKGPEFTNAPSQLRNNVAVARKALTARGFTVKVVRAPYFVNAGVVVAQDQTGKLATGSTITLTIV